MVNFSELELLLSVRYHEKRNPVLVDVGAHHGTVSEAFVKKGWSVIAFEPERRNFAALQRNLGECAGVQLINKAVSNVSGDHVPFYVSDEHYGIHSLKPFHSTHRLAYQVETVRLDAILDRLHVPSVTLLKIDIEGADFLALQGFDFCRHRPELVMAEFMDERSYPNFMYRHHDMAAHMVGYGYIAYVSEWAPTAEYGREGIATLPHEWRSCRRYPLDHEPSWGNLIFVREGDGERFEETLRTYLRKLATRSQPEPRWRRRVRRLTKLIRGA